MGAAIHACGRHIQQRREIRRARLLYVLAEGGGMRAAAIRVHMGISSSSLADDLVELVDRGLVEQVDRGGGSRPFYCLTPKGLACAPADVPDAA